MDLPQVDPNDVPTDLRALVPHANILGVGDDPLRGLIVRAVGQEYLDLALSNGSRPPKAIARLAGRRAADRKYRKQYAVLDWMLRALGVGLLGLAQ